jgi:dTDP-4-amino-4,6-dideoxygalactose transaminase
MPPATPGPSPATIRLAAPDIDDGDIAAVAAVLRSGHLVQGPQVARFEARIAELTGAAHAIAVANCTAALHLSLLALGIGPGDRVAVPTYSWPATANVVVLVGAEPCFVDIDPVTFTMRPDALAAVAERAGRLAAVLPVHAFGGMADMAGLAAVADALGAPVVEDAACALGATLDGRPAGRFGVAGCFSFHPRTAVTTGEGGAIVTDDRVVARVARTLRNHGQDPEASAPTFVAAGYNLRMTDLQAALGVSQLAKFERLAARRRDLAAAYGRALGGPAALDAGIVAPGALAGAAPVYQSYVVLLPAGAAPRRAEVIAALAARGIETTLGTYHMPLLPIFAARGHRPGDFPVTDDVAARALSLPLSTAMADDDPGTVVDALVEVLAALRAPTR